MRRRDAEQSSRGLPLEHRGACAEPDNEVQFTRFERGQLESGLMQITQGYRAIATLALNTLIIVVVVELVLGGAVEDS